MNGVVASLYTGAVAGAALGSVNQATLEAGRGIIGDRYHLGEGTFSAKLAGKPDFEITLIEQEEVDRFNCEQGLSLDAGALRRNVVTRDVRLNDLVGIRFRVGKAILEGIRLCEPCARLAGLVDPRVLPALVHRAGLRARIVSGGVIYPGDDITAA